jgi:GT2 family glycosyltransferase
VADARPVNEQWIEKLLSGFTSKNVVAAVGPQGSPSEPEYYPREWLISRLKSRHQAFNLFLPEFGPVADNCNTLYKKSALAEIKFPEATFGEDIMWSKLIKEKGYEISMVPEAGVYHYHVKSFSHFKERSIHLQMSLDKYFDLDLGSTIAKRIHVIIIFVFDYFKVLSFVGFNTWMKWFPFHLKMAVARMSGFRDYYRNGKSISGTLKREELRNR